MFLPEIDRDYLTEKGYSFEEIVDSGRNCLIIHDWILPVGKYNLAKSDLLIQMPPNYPDVMLDMWYFYPAILLSSANKYATATDVMQQFVEKNWQRWSRHSNDWRSGIDCLRTFFVKIENALNVAQ